MAATFDIHDHWWSHAGHISNLTLHRAYQPNHKSIDYRDSSMHGYRYAAEIDTSMIWHGVLPDRVEPWSFLLGRQHKNQPWRIVDWGQ